MDITLKINGEVQALSIDPRVSLLDALRERLHLTGTKEGCNQGACGACLTLAVMHDGAEITTIEGLAHDDELHPLQAAFSEPDGFQCGYCTPGQIMSEIACIAEGHTGSAAEIREWMSGNICRCGAYPHIVAAVTQAALARMYIFPAASAPPQPFGWTVARSYSTRIAIGVVVRSTTRRPPPRSVTNVRRSVESMTGQRGYCPAGGRDPRTPPRSASGTAPGRASRPAPG